jgi:CDP-diacylglycerol--glycerol-3-phosphate 3-phosphatidyltransferase
MTPVLLYLMIRGEYGRSFAVFVAICLSDMLDGAIARALGVCTRLGAYMDVSADLVYIVSSLVALNILRLAPVWFTGLVLFKFAEFTVTSHILRKNRTGSCFILDLPGRLSAALFFALPGVICLFQWMPFQGSGTVIVVLLSVTVTLTLASSCARFLLCIDRKRMRGIRRQLGSGAK